MDKIVGIISFLLISILICGDKVVADSIATIEDRGYFNCSNTASINRNRISDYSYKKLADAEEYLFGENFAGQNLITRIERLEDNIFGRYYSNSSIDQRVNNIIYNYNRTSASNSRFKTTKFRNILDGFNQAFFGVPTGFTPPIYTDPYYNWNNVRNYGGYNDYYDRNGWRRYRNTLGTNSGIHIID